MTFCPLLFDVAKLKGKVESVFCSRAHQQKNKGFFLWAGAVTIG